MPPLPWPKRRPPKNTLGPHRIPWAKTSTTKPTAQAAKNTEAAQSAQVHKKKQAQRLGIDAENRAQQYLEDHGLVLLARNHRCRCGEVDLIMAHGRTAVAVEVRCRSSEEHGSALASVTWAKQQRIRRCASLWWQNHGHMHFTHLRFDVVADNGEGVIDWVQNAWLS